MAFMSVLLMCAVFTVIMCIAAGAIFGLLFLIIAVIAFVIWRKRRKAKVLEQGENISR